jgi:hypothetical protein
VPLFTQIQRRIQPADSVNLRSLILRVIWRRDALERARDRSHQRRRRGLRLQFVNGMEMRLPST